MPKKVFHAVTNEDVYKQIVKLQEKLDEHLESARISRLHIRFLWASVSALAGALGTGFLYLINLIK